MYLAIFEGSTLLSFSDIMDVDNGGLEREIRELATAHGRQNLRIFVVENLSELYEAMYS